MAMPILSQSYLSRPNLADSEHKAKFACAFNSLKQIYIKEAEFLGVASDAINSAINNYDYKHIINTLLITMQAQFFDPKLLPTFIKTLLDILDLSAMIAGQSDDLNRLTN